MASRVNPVFYTCLLSLLALFPMRATRAASCESLAALKLEDTTIAGAALVPPGPLSVNAGPLGPPSGRAPLVLPAFCRVQLVVAPAIKIELWLPTSGWNGRFEAVGNGGYAGSISYPAMAEALKLGYATASTDTGHEGDGRSAAWALHHPELVVDYGYRAVHEMTLKAKRIVEAFYGAAAQISYFNGCSTGGRQGLMEAQRYPDDYTGILAGAPANYFTHLQTGASLWVALATLKDPESYIPPTKLPAINRASVAACDSLDGIKDGLINNPRLCKFDPSTLLCKGEDSAACLTAKQLEALKKIYSGAHDAHGKEIFPGYMPGDEQNWVGFITGPAPYKAGVYDLGVDFIKYMVFDNPNWDFRTWNYETDTQIPDDKLTATLNATDPSLKAFRSRGGKLILYHGWTDPAIPSMNTVNYYKSVVTTMSGVSTVAAADETEDFFRGVKQVEDFVRLFMVPGMDHCFGGPGPNTFNAFGALVNWVEHKQAPEKIVASHITSGTVDRTRPLCPYPMTAQSIGQGSTDDAANFVCKLPGEH
jgi:feruloyl esterase